jgi:hypothetical protein
MKGISRRVVGYPLHSRHKLDALVETGVVDAG